jgi:hypothetical protein
VTADENLLNIWEISETQKIVASQEFNEKIIKVVYSSGKLIIVTEQENMY